MRTFLRIELQPSFSYAVVDPNRAAGQANVLFHSNEDAELVERLQNEIDDPDAFDRLVAQALAQSEALRRREEAAAPAAGPGGESAARAPEAPVFRMDTNYRARPARLTIAALDPHTDWMLVIIEDRNDAGFAIWRASTFGYAIWLTGALLIGLAVIVARMRGSKGMDRRPGMSLWPRRRLADFTPPRLAQEAQRREDLASAAIMRDRHLACVFLGALCGLPAAEGAGRILFAFAVCTVTLASRTYFDGETASDRAAARKWAWRSIWLGFGLLVLAAVTCLLAMARDYEFRGLVTPRLGWVDLVIKLRFLFYVLGTFLLWRCLMASLAFLRGKREDPAAAPPGRLRGWARAHLFCWKSKAPRRDLGWLLALTLLGAAPAAAGFLDSYDQDSFLLVERGETYRANAEAQRQRAFEAIRLSMRISADGLERKREALRPGAAAPQATQEGPKPASGAQDAARQTPPARASDRQPGMDQCYSLSCFAIYYLGLHEQALEYSDFVPVTLGDAFRPSQGIAKLILMPILIGFPAALYLLCVLFFRSQYFRPSPSLPLGKDPEFDPPLSFTRSEFIERALRPAASGRDPGLPFSPAGYGHVILGIGLDLKRDRAADGVRLEDDPGIAWLDLIHAEPAVASGNAVVIGNLDLALRMGGETAETAYQTIRTLIETRGKRQLFLLADIDPLDRIATLWDPTRDSSDPAQSETCGPAAWRWAQLIEDFTVFPIRPTPETAAPPVQTRILQLIHEELSVLETSFARELQEQLRDRVGQAVGKKTVYDAAPERILSFIAEQMGDYYNRLWASSSDEERVMLYRLACDCHLKMNDSRAQRSLLTRGLIVRTPEYRLMNRSFAIYVCRLGATAAIRESAQRVGGLDSVWPVIRYPLAAIAVSGVVLLQFIAPSAASGAIGTLPALLALVPAMIGRWFQDRPLAG